MALTSDRLESKLLRFCDASDPNFEGFPTTRKTARAKWAAAFDDYLSVIEEKIPRPPPPPNSHPSIQLGDVEGAFFDTLALTPIGVARSAALDFAGAWRAAIAAIKAGGAATDSAGGSYAFTAFANASTLHDALANTLEGLFTAPSTGVKARIGEIAEAFHTATTGLMATVAYTNPSGATSTIQIGVQ